MYINYTHTRSGTTGHTCFAQAIALYTATVQCSNYILSYECRPIKISDLKYCYSSSAMIIVRTRTLGSESGTLELHM